MQLRHLSGLWKFVLLIVVVVVMAGCGGGAKSAVPAAAPTQTFCAGKGR